MATIGTLIVELSGNVARLEADLKQAGRHVQNTERMVSNAVGNMNAVFGTLGITLGAGAFVHFIKGSIDATDRLNDLSKTTSLTVEQLSGVSLAAKLSGSDLNGTANAIGKLAENMGKDSAKFAQLGITAKDPLEAFKQLSDVFNSIQDPQKRAAFGAEALGKSWKQAAPLLAEGSVKIGEMIDKGTRLAGVTSDMADAAGQFNDQMDIMDVQAGRLGMTLANQMLPSLTSTATEMNKLVEEGKPLLALWRALAGMGQIPYDFLRPPANLKKELSADGMIKGLEADIARLERKKANSFSDDNDDVDAEIAMLEARVETIRKHAAELDKRTSDTVKKGASPDVSKFIGNPAADGLAKAEEARYKEFEKMVEERRKAEAQASADDFKQIQRWNDMIDPAAKYRNEIEDIRFSMQEKGGVDQAVGEANIALLEKQIAGVDAHARQSAELADAQSARFTELRELAEFADATDLARVQNKQAKELADLEIQRMMRATDHELTLGELESFERAKADIIAKNRGDIVQAESNHLSQLLAMAARGALQREDYERLSGKNQVLLHAGMMQNIIGVSAQHSQAMFSLMKGAKLAQAAITLPETVMHAYNSGMQAGGPFGPAVGAAYAALAFTSQMIQINAIKSASFGGGTGGSAPSAGGASSIAIPGQTADPGTIGNTTNAVVPKTGTIVSINIGDDGMYSASAVRKLIEKINEQIQDGATIDQIQAS